MRFDNPQAFYLLLAWLVLLWLMWRAGRWRRESALKLGQLELLDRLYPASVRAWRRRRGILMLLACLLLIVSAARPQYGRIEQTVRSQGTNVLIALDCSKSMLAQDVMPTRLDRAKQTLSTLLRRLIGNRVGLIAFSGRAFLQCPMTLDHTMANLVLGAMDTNSVGVGGTNVGEAIRVATQAFDRGAGEGGRALVLLTDGEDLEHEGIKAAEEAAKKGVRIYAIGIGTVRGAPLADPERGGFREDESGSKINTKLDMETLQKIASATKGLAYDAGDSPERALSDVVQQIEAQQKADFEARRLVIYQDRFQWFLLPALLLLVWMLLSRPEQSRLEARS